MRVGNRHGRPLSAKGGNIPIACVAPWHVFCAACRGIFSERLAFVACGIACLLSTGAWLVVASGIQRCADYERAANIELFIADPNAPVPPPVHGLDMPPRWLRGWNALNIALFVVLIGDIVRSLLALLPAA